MVLVLIFSVNLKILPSSGAYDIGKSSDIGNRITHLILPLIIINLMAVSIPHVLSGTYVAEAVFHYPGLGALSVESAKYHDYNLLMLLVLMTGVLVIVSSMAARFVNEMIDPRMKSREVAD